MVDRYHKGGYALLVPVGAECGDVCEKEEKFCELISCKINEHKSPRTDHLDDSAGVLSLSLPRDVFFPQNTHIKIGK